MTNYTLWADRGTGSQDIYKVAEHLKKCAGGSVKVLGVGPSVGQNYGLHAGKGTVAVYQTNGVGLATPNDLNLGCKPSGYYQYDRAIFIWPQWIDNQWMSDKNIQEHIVKGEWDWNRSQAYNVGGQTAAKWFSNAQYVDLVAGTSPADVAQRICNGAYVTASGNPGSSSTGTSDASGTNGSANGSASSGSSPLLTGDMTFEELVGEICNGIDLVFLPKKTTVVVDDFESLYAEAKYLRENNSSVVESENIKLWQLEEDSYELEVNQHGFYNTVYVTYKNGVIKESYNEFVRVYGEIPIRYKHPTLDKTNAIAKAKAYLAAHIRDFNMVVNLSMLTDGDIDIGDIITVENPQTLNNQIRLANNRDPEYLFVKGRNISWEGEQDIMTDLECTYAPESPERKDVPASGTATGTNADSDSSGTASGASGSYNKCGVSSDGKTICAIGQASAPGERSKYGGNYYRSIFKNWCPFCKEEALIWDIFWAGESTDYGFCKCKGTSEGGSIEGHIFCKNCDADFSTVEGKDHMSPPRAQLKRIDGPVKVTKTDAYNLKKGIYST